MTKLFVSTASFAYDCLPVIFEAAKKYNIRGIELSSGIRYDEKQDSYLESAGITQSSFDLLMHNYFPPPKNPFVLNLASNDQATLRKSMAHCRKAIDLCAHYGIPFFSVHAGFCFHAAPGDLGKKQTELPRIPMNKAKGIFFESIGLLSAYAVEKGVNIAVENNVLARFNLINGGNELLLGVTAEDMQELYEAVDNDNLFFLLDVGHCFVSSQTLGFNPEAMIRNMARHVIAVHLSENNGVFDNNLPVGEKSWFWNALNRYMDDDISYILEAYNLTIETIIKQLFVISNQLIK